MATASPNALDQFLERFISQVDSGFGLIRGDVGVVFGTLVVISVGMTAVLWAIDENQNVTGAFIRKVLLVGFFAWVINSWHDLSQTVVNGFASLGLKAASGSLNISDFLNAPSRVVVLGFTDAYQILIYIGRLCQSAAGLGFFANFDAILIAAVSAIGLIIAFIILGVEVAVTIIEFHIVTLVAFVTVPFGVLSQTAFMSERAIGYVASVGVKLMALALVVSIGESVFKDYVVSTDPTVNELCGLLLASVLMVMLALKIPGIAGALISGGPQLSAGSALAGAAGVAAGTAGVALAGRMAAGRIAGALGKVGSATVAAGALPGGRAESGGAGGAGPSGPAGGGSPGSGSGFPASVPSNSGAASSDFGPGAPAQPEGATPAASAAPATAAEAVAATRSPKRSDAPAAGSVGTDANASEAKAVAQPSPAETVASARRRTVKRLATVVAARAAAGAHAQGGGGGMTPRLRSPEPAEEQA